MDPFGNISFFDSTLFNLTPPEFIWPLPEEDQLPPEFPLGLRVMLTACYCIIMVGALAGNILVIAVIASNKSMRTITNVFLVSLAVSDILIGGWNVPLTLIYHLNNEWTLGEPICKTTSFMSSVNVVASITTLTAVAIERYYAICHPLKARYSRRNERVAIVLSVIAIVWVLAIAVSLPFVWIQRQEWRLLEQLDKDPPVRIAFVCAEYYSEHTMDVAHTIVSFVLWFIVPMGIMMFAYGNIAHKLWVRKPIGHTQGTPQNIEKSNQQKRKIIKMLIVVVLLFVLCWLPFNALQMYRLAHSISSDLRIALALVQLLGFSNSMMNPIIYGFMNQKFKQSLRMMCLRCRKITYVGKINNGSNAVVPNSITIESVV